MTEEEKADKLAEDYVMREDTITENDRVPFDNGYGFQTVDFEKEVKKGYKDGFLAGVKENGVVWHDLKKDPNDLPSDENKLYLVIVYIWNCNYRKYGNYLPTVCEWNKEWNRFESMDRMANAHDCYKWCEIPQFKE